MRPWHRLTIPALTLVTLMAPGCSSPTTSPDQPQPQAPAPDNTNENTNPTAMHLHDLAGELILYQVKSGNLPDRLTDLPSGAKASIDPATGKPYRYLPAGPRIPNLPGRLLVCQSTPDPTSGRWALLINDYASDGRLITYVQRVDESVFTRLQTGGGW